MGDFRTPQFATEDKEEVKEVSEGRVYSMTLSETEGG